MVTLHTLCLFCRNLRCHNTVYFHSVLYYLFNTNTDLSLYFLDITCISQHKNRFGSPFWTNLVQILIRTNSMIILDHPWLDPKLPFSYFLVPSLLTFLTQIPYTVCLSGSTSHNKISDPRSQRSSSPFLISSITWTPRLIIVSPRFLPEVYWTYIYKYPPSIWSVAPAPLSVLVLFRMDLFSHIPDPVRDSLWLQ